MAQFGQIAKAGNTIVVPANVGDVAGMIATALSAVKAVDRPALGK